jgi:hypothetical protein
MSRRTGSRIIIDIHNITLVCIQVYLYLRSFDFICTHYILAGVFFKPIRAYSIYYRSINRTDKLGNIVP